jgi:hypothetical protein
MFKRSQLNRSKDSVSLIETFKIVSINMWFESWFRSKRVLQIRIRSLRLFVVKHMSMIDSDFWKWKYVDVSLEKLNCNRNSFIMSSISNDLLFDRVVTSSHDEWWMLKSFTIKWFLNFLWDEWYAITIVISLVRKFLLNRGSFLTHRLFCPTNQYFCTIVTSHLEILIDQFDHLTSDYCSVDQLSDSYELEIALFCRFYLLIRSFNQDFELKISIEIWARWVLPQFISSNLTSVHEWDNRLEIRNEERQTYHQRVNYDHADLTQLSHLNKWAQDNRRKSADLKVHWFEYWRWEVSIIWIFHSSWLFSHERECWHS